MACKQESLTLSITGEMVNKAVQSYTFSKRYTKIMVRASLLNIMYQRLVLNEKDLKIKRFQGVSFVVFKRDRAKDTLLNQYLVWIKGITEAIEKDYLKEVFLYMKNSQTGELIETYRIYLKYNKDGVKGNKYPVIELKQSTLELFQTFMDLGKYEKINENTIVQIELTYLDGTPPKYEPPAFESSKERYYLSIPTCSNHMGTLKTGFHKIEYYGGGQVFNNRPVTPTVSVVSEVIHEEQSLTPEALDATIVDNQSMVEHIEETEEEASFAKASAFVAVPDTVHNISNITVSDNVGMSNMSMVSGKSDVVLMTEEYFNCICMLNIPLDVDVIKCSTCNKQYHAPCHGYLNKDATLREMFNCICCNSNDQVFGQFNIDEHPLLAKVRLILYFMEKEGVLPMDILKMMDTDDRNKIIHKIECFNVFQGHGSNKINKAKLRQVMRKFFIIDEDSQMLY